MCQINNYNSIENIYRKLENKRIIFFTSMKKSPGKSRKEAVYSFFEGWSTMDINTTPPILPIFFHVCCRWKILTVYHVIMFLLLKLVDTWTFQERKMVTKTCASLKKMKCVTSFTIRVWKNCQNILFVYELIVFKKLCFSVIPKFDDCEWII